MPRMPTPFTHLRIAQDLLDDEALNPRYRDFLHRQRPAFQLGSIAADARVASGDAREVTHFYAYNQPVVQRPWRAMLRRYPQLRQVRDEAQLAFLAGYVAHLAADEAWTLKMARPHFWAADWQGAHRQDKFFALHLILTVWDERDEIALADWQAASLRRAAPQPPADKQSQASYERDDNSNYSWLPFMSDEVLRHWRDLVAAQLAPAGASLTLEIFGKRLRMDPAQLRAALDDPSEMRRCLWRFVPQSLLEQVTRLCYAFARDQLAVYLTETLPALERA